MSDKIGKKEVVESKEITNSSSVSFVRIPISVLVDRNVSVFEAIVEYLKDEVHYRFSEIATMTNRDDRTIWTVYHRARKKRESAPKKELPKTEIFVPLNVLLDRKLAVLEALVEYLKEKMHLTYHEIAVLMNRNDRTIWTVYSRARKKRLT